MRLIVLSFFLLSSSLQIAKAAKPNLGYPISQTFVGHLQVQPPPPRTTPDQDHICYATLVSPYGHVLTAAHCLVTDPTNSASRALPLQMEMYDGGIFNLTPIWWDPFA